MRTCSTRGNGMHVPFKKMIFVEIVWFSGVEHVYIFGSVSRAISDLLSFNRVRLAFICWYFTVNNTESRNSYNMIFFLVILHWTGLDCTFAMRQTVMWASTNVYYTISHIVENYLHSSMDVLKRPLLFSSSFIALREGRHQVFKHEKRVQNEVNESFYYFC